MRTAARRSAYRRCMSHRLARSDTTVHSFQIVLSSLEFSALVPSDYGRGLRGHWTKVMNAKIREHF